MASLSLLKDSGTGDVVGIESKQRTELYSLTVDSVTDDPQLKARTLKPYYSVHWQDRTLQLQSWTTGERKGPLVWEMTAEFSRATKKGLDEFSDWTITVQSNSGMVRLFQEIPDANNPNAERKVVGPLRYKKYVEGEVTPEPAVLYKTSTTEGDIFLYQIGKQARADGMDVVGGDVAIQMRRTFTRMTPRTIYNVANYKRGVNSKPFIDNVFPARTVLFTDFAIEESIGQIPGSTTSSYIYRATLNFAYNKDGHTPLIRTDTYIDDDGYESVVKTTAGEEIRREFRRYDSLNFDNLIREFYT